MARGFFLAMAVATALTGCETVREFNEERYGNNNDRGRAWLSDQIEPEAVNISGTWISEDWGRSAFFQSGRTVRGHLGDYPVEGVVSGNKAYLLVSEGGWYYYSAVLEMPSDSLLIGYYSRSVPYERSRRRDLRLDRTGR